MKSSFLAIAIAVAGVSIAHATDRCTDDQFKQALSSAPARNGSVLVAKAVLGEPTLTSVTVQVYDAEKEGYPLVCERRLTLPSVSQISLSAHRDSTH